MTSSPNQNERDLVYVMPVRVGQPPGTIQLAFLWQAALSRWWLIVGIGLALGSLALALSFLITPVYRAQAIVLSVAEDSGSGALSQLSSQFGGLAALAGVSLGAPGGTRAEALAILNGRSFTEDFVRQNDLLPTLFASKWDAEAKKWRVSGSRIPTLQDGAEKLQREVLTVMDDPKSGLISVSVDWRDSEAGAQWANGIIDMLNRRMRVQAIDDASARLKFLDEELTRATELELRTAIYSLMESQLKSIMVAKTRQDFALQMLDRARPSDPDKYVRPNRIVLTCLGLFVGALIGIWVAARADQRQRRAAGERHAMVAENP
ncbi:MAG: Wzz/FepE/Etk N-terminal domain-containing protein [Gammaproteobacteria bacterium]